MDCYSCVVSGFYRIGNHLLGNDMTEYQPTYYSVEESTLLNSIDALVLGLEYARECLARHEQELGRTTLKNKRYAESMEQDMELMRNTLQLLRVRTGTNLAPANAEVSEGGTRDSRIETAAQSRPSLH